MVVAAGLLLAAPVPAAHALDLTRQIDGRSAFDYATRTGAARLLRRAPATDVAPALVATAAPPDEPVQRALVAEVGRGFDFFPRAVIEMLGERRAGYPVDTIAPVAILDGSLQDDAVLVPRRIGDRRGSKVLLSLEARPAAVAAAPLIDRLEF